MNIVKEDEVIVHDDKEKLIRCEFKKKKYIIILKN